LNLFSSRHFGGKVRPCLVDLLRKWPVPFSSCFEHSAWGTISNIGLAEPQTLIIMNLRLSRAPI
jgi:hypothetical protein